MKTRVILNFFVTENPSEDCTGRLPSDRFGDRKATKSSQTNDSGQDTEIVICQRCQSSHLARDYDLDSDLDDEDDMATTMEQGWIKVEPVLSRDRS